ncbi:hypothetical protein EGR_10432 [Echinococcus granulosus]|uniref:Uncharacterized protein n=1 Tax=Echinococcus granulosus TaxID=6210 RepID=W6U101_ECHGR|nr:hypothetical protein EGR_10432 [Echinococcus granulosus]EUB54713.1 hypothetical protein EGR_10432 [Echinococcus granulosus]
MLAKKKIVGLVTDMVTTRLRWWPGSGNGFYLPPYYASGRESELPTSKSAHSATATTTNHLSAPHGNGTTFQTDCIVEHFINDEYFFSRNFEDI